jgi:hypothetical protein
MNGNKLQSKIYEELYSFHKASLNELIKQDSSIVMIVMKQGINPKDFDAYADSIMKSVAKIEAEQIIQAIDKNHYTNLVNKDRVLKIIGEFPNELNIGENTIAQIRDISERSNGAIGDKIGEYLNSHGNRR